MPDGSGALTINDVVQLVRDGGLVTLLLFILIGGYRGWWVWGHQYTAIRNERDEWKSLFLRSIKVTEVAVTVAQKS